MDSARIALSGFTSVISVAPPRTAATCMTENAESPLLGGESSNRCHVGPGVALLGGLLARLGFPADARFEWGDDNAARLLEEAAAIGSPLLRVTARSSPSGQTRHCRLGSWRDFSFVETPFHPAYTFASEDLPGAEIHAKTVGVWCYPSALLGGGAQTEALFESRLESAAQRGVTQVLVLGPPQGRRSNGEPWQSWLVRLLPYTDILCAQADDLVCLLDEAGAGRLREDGRLHDLPSWLTGGILHHLSHFLTSCGVGCVVLGLRDEGVYQRTNEDSNRIAFVRKFAPDDQIAAHLASWTGREILIPPFAVDLQNRYSGTDALAAGIVGSLVRGLTPEDAVRMAAAVVGFAAEGTDPLQTVDSWEVVQARVEGGWEQGHCHIDLRGWSDEES